MDDMITIVLNKVIEVIEDHDMSEEEKHELALLLADTYK